MWQHSDVTGAGGFSRRRWPEADTYTKYPRLCRGCFFGARRPDSSSLRFNLPREYELCSRRGGRLCPPRVFCTHCKMERIPTPAVPPPARSNSAPCRRDVEDAVPYKRASLPTRRWQGGRDAPWKGADRAFCRWRNSAAVLCVQQAGSAMAGRARRTFTWCRPPASAPQYRACSGTAGSSPDHSPPRTHRAPRSRRSRP